MALTVRDGSATLVTLTVRDGSAALVTLTVRDGSATLVTGVVLRCQAFFGTNVQYEIRIVLYFFRGTSSGESIQTLDVAAVTTICKPTLHVDHAFLAVIHVVLLGLKPDTHCIIISTYASVPLRHDAPDDSAALFTVVLGTNTFLKCKMVA